jgi:hypothetical protein
LSNSCTACGHFNSKQSSFCEMCGTPTSTKKSSFEPDQCQISLGYSSIPGGAEGKNTFFILDTSSIYNEAKQKIILLVIVRGLSDYLNILELRDVLLSRIIYRASGIDHRKILVELKDSIDKQLTSNALNDFKEKGLLISIVDNQKVNSLCFGDPCLFIIPEKDEMQVFRGIITDAIMPEIALSDGTTVVFTSHDLESLVDKKEVIKLISHASTAQIACVNIVNLIKAKISSISLAVIKTGNH